MKNNIDDDNVIVIIMILIPLSNIIKMWFIKLENKFIIFLNVLNYNLNNLKTN